MTSRKIDTASSSSFLGDPSKKKNCKILDIVQNSLTYPPPKANLDIISFGQFDFDKTPPPPSIIWTYFKNYLKIIKAISSKVRYLLTRLLILKPSLKIIMSKD